MNGGVLKGYPEQAVANEVLKATGNGLLKLGDAPPAAAGSLTGTTLAPNVTASSLLSFGNSPALSTPTITGGSISSPTITGTIAGTPTITSPTISGTPSISGATITTSTLTTPNITQGTSSPTFTTSVYTLVLGDAGNLLLASNGGTAGSVKIPTNATVAFPVGTQIHIIQTGSGQLTISAVTGGTTSVLHSGATAGQPKLRVQYSTATMLKTATDVWYVFGDIA